MRVVLASILPALVLVACSSGPTPAVPDPAPASVPPPAPTEAATAAPSASAEAPPVATTAPVAAEAPTAAPPAAPAQPKGPSYVACGCGCCGGTTPRKECLYRAKGDDLQKIIDQDKKASKSPSCRVAGCSLGTEYSYCD